jgi:hypothetical protein
VIPGTHRLGLLADAEIGALTGSRPSAVCCVPRGGVLAMSPLLLHASSKASAARPRRVLHFEYTATSTFEGGLETAIS